MSNTNDSKKRHAAHRREIRFFRAIFLTSVLSQTEGGDFIHRIFKRLLNFCFFLQSLVSYRQRTEVHDFRDGLKKSC